MIKIQYLPARNPLRLKCLNRLQACILRSGHVVGVMQRIVAFRSFAVTLYCKGPCDVGGFSPVSQLLPVTSLFRPQSPKTKEPRMRFAVTICVQEDADNRSGSRALRFLHRSRSYRHRVNCTERQFFFLYFANNQPRIQFTVLRHGHKVPRMRCTNLRQQFLATRLFSTLVP